jgi:hypothetical protein
MFSEAGRGAHRGARGATDVVAAWLGLTLACGDGGGTAPSPDCDVPGHACTWAGVPTHEGFNGDGQHRLETELYWPLDLHFASDGVPWFIDWNNHLVRSVNDDQTVRTVLGWIDPVFPGDGAANQQESTEAGALGTEVQLNHPTDLEEMADGTILVMAWHNHKLRRLDPTTLRVTVSSGRGAGFSGDGGPARAALFRQPKALAFDDEGNLYILDQQNFRIRKIDREFMISTIAGSGQAGTLGDDGPANGAQLSFEAGSNPEPSGGLAVVGGQLYFADTMSHRLRVIDLQTGIVRAFAGTGVAGFSGDGGPALEAQFRAPRDLELGPDGSLYVADTDNGVIRAIDLGTGLVRTVAGTGQLGHDEAEGKQATMTPLRRPFGIAFDAPGNLYVADTLNSRILRVAR